MADEDKKAPAAAAAAAEGPAEGKKAKVPAPNEKEHKAKTELLTKEIKELEEEREKVRIPPKTEAERKQKSPMQLKRDELFAQLKVLREKKQPLQDERKKLLDQQDKIKAQLTKKSEEMKQAKASGKFKKPEDVDAQIRKLEQRLEERPPLKEEKEIVTEINALKRSKKNLGDIDTSKMGLDQLRASLNTMRDSSSALRDQINEIRTQENDIKSELDKCKEPGVAADIKKRQERYREIKVLLDEKYSTRRALNKAFAIAKRAHYEATKVEREAARKARQEEKKAYEEAKRAERERKQKEYEEYLASRPPYEDEMTTCKVLIGYLEGIVPAAAGAGAPAAPASTGRATENDEVDGRFKSKDGSFLVGKKGKDDDEFFMKMGGGKNKKKKGKKKQGATKKLKHAPKVFEQFAEIKLTPPTSMDEATTSLQAVKDKLAYYKTAPPPEKKKSKKEAKAEKKAAAAAEAEAEGEGEYEEGEYGEDGEYYGEDGEYYDEDGEYYEEEAAEGEEAPASAEAPAEKEAPAAAAPTEAAAAPEKKKFEPTTKWPKETPLPAENLRTYDDDAAHGKKCPDVSGLVYCKGEEVKVGAGKPVLVLFFAKFAKGDYVNVIQVSDLVVETGIDTIGISIDPEKTSCESFIQKFGKAMAEIHVDCLRAEFPLAFDAGKVCKKAFQALANLSSLGASSVFLVNGDGTIVWREQFSQGHTVNKGQLREQTKRILAGTDLIKNGDKPAADDEDDELSDMDMDIGDEDEDGLLF